MPQVPADIRWPRARRLLGRGRVALTGPWGVPLAAAAIAAIVLWLAADPLAGPTNDTDSAASVLYFQRLVAGARLEAFVPTTSKPLLTVGFGLLWQLTHDWRALTIATLAIGAAGVGLAAAVTRRLAGLTAAAFIVTALLAWPDFRVEVAHANSFVPAFTLWLLAALLVTEEPPRARAAGCALLMAGLARPETAWLVVGAAGGLATLIVLRPTGRTLQPRQFAPLLIGGLALPIVSIHDWLLTGQPLYWLQVARDYTVLVYPGLARVGPGGSLHNLWLLYWPDALTVVLAFVGLSALVSGRRWAPAIALAGLAFGVMLTLVVLAARRTYIDSRYLEELNAPLLVAAAIGAGAITREVASRWFRGDSPVVVARTPGLPIAPVGAVRTFGLPIAPVAAVRTFGLPIAPVAAVRTLGLVITGVVAALLLAWPRTDSTVAAAELARWREANVRLSTTSAFLPTIVALPHGTTMTIAGVGFPVADPRTCSAFVPRPLIPRIAVETGARITSLGDSYLAFRRRTYDVLAAGQWVLHIAAADGIGGAFEPFEGAATTPAPEAATSPGRRPLTIAPVLADPARGIWLDRIEAQPAG